jgi:branched-chain amino acid transport system ATP-binding protein
LFDASQMGDTPGAEGPDAGPDDRDRRAISVPIDTEAVQKSVLYADHITIQFGGLVAVDDVSFTIPPKSVVSLIGPNGAGKTTFFNVITGLYKVTSGIVFLEGKDITNVKPYDRAAMGLARTFQNIRLFNLMTAEENVMVAMHSHLKSGVLSTIIRTPGQRRRSASPVTRPRAPGVRGHRQERG